MEKGQDGLVGGGIYRPDKKPFVQQALSFFFNKDTGAIMGRTPLSWVKILLFYIIFYVCLAAFFSLLMLVVNYTLDPRIPKYQQDSSLIGSNPGLGFRPMPSEMNSLSTLIWYKGTQKENYEYWTEALEEFLTDYKKPGGTPGRGANIFKCSYGTPTPRGKVCEVDIRSIDHCIYENDYGYKLQRPCVFLKLNKIFGWEPQAFKIDQLPEEMPEELKDHIKNEYLNVSESHMNTIWVHCEGESPADVENLGPIIYRPRRGFPFYYFPYENDEGYLSPLVAIEIQNPKKGILINIECKAWAANIVHDRKERIGSVHFELMID